MRHVIAQSFTLFAQVGILAALILFATSTNYLYAQWSNPTSAPPAIAEIPPLFPINISSTAQVKDGNVSFGASANASVAGVNPLGVTVAGSQRVEGWFKVGDGAVGNPTQSIDIAGVAGTDGIKFPDGTVQTGALPAGATLIFNLGACPTGWSATPLVAPAPGYLYCAKN